MEALLDRLYPAPAMRVPLAGVYLAHALRERARPGRPYIYSNFIASLDGRIALRDPVTNRPRLPKALRHPHDWHAYLELAAQADAVLISGRRLRELGTAAKGAPLQCLPELGGGELAQWRRTHGLPVYPTCVALSATLDLPLEAMNKCQDALIVLTGSQAPASGIEALRESGIEVMQFAQAHVTGAALYRFLLERAFRTVYAVGGPDVLATLLATGHLDRLYLTFALRLLGGAAFDALLRTDLALPMDFELHELYHDKAERGHPALLLATFGHGR